MNRTKAQKQEMVTTLAAQVAKSQTIYVTNFTGLNVANITDLRRRLRFHVPNVDVRGTAPHHNEDARLLGPGGLRARFTSTRRKCRVVRAQRTGQA